MSTAVEHFFGAVGSAYTQVPDWACETLLNYMTIGRLVGAGGSGAIFSATVNVAIDDLKPGDEVAMKLCIPTLDSRSCKLGWDIEAAILRELDAFVRQGACHSFLKMYNLDTCCLFGDDVIETLREAKELNDGPLGNNLFHPNVGLEREDEDNGEKNSRIRNLLARKIPNLHVAAEIANIERIDVQELFEMDIENKAEWPTCVPYIIMELIRDGVTLQQSATLSDENEIKIKNGQAITKNPRMFDIGTLFEMVYSGMVMKMWGYTFGDNNGGNVVMRMEPRFRVFTVGTDTYIFPPGVSMVRIDPGVKVEFRGETVKTTRVVLYNNVLDDALKEKLRALQATDDSPGEGVTLRDTIRGVFGNHLYPGPIEFLRDLSTKTEDPTPMQFSRLSTYAPIR